MKNAEETLKKGLAINSSDKDFLHELKILKNKETAEELKKLKAEASELLKKNNAEGALNIYVKSLKMLENTDNPSDYLSILQNQCVCYLKLQQYDSIISTSIRILKIVNGMKNKIVEFGEKKNTIEKS